MKHGWCEQVGEVKLTRSQYKEYWNLKVAYDMRQYCYRVWKSRESNPELKQRELAKVAEEEKELSRWHWRAAGVIVLFAVAAAVIALLSVKYDFDTLYALSPIIPVIAAAVWGDQMENTLQEGKNPWTELAKLMVFSVLALVLIYISFIFILVVFLLFKPSKIFRG